MEAIPEPLRLLGLFAVIIGLLWLLRFALARLTGALLPRLVESREVIDGELAARSPLYARFTRGPAILIVGGALAALLIWWVGETRRGIIGAGVLGAAWLLSRTGRFDEGQSLVIARGVLAFAVLGYLAWLILR